ncbi:GMC oxidoreductase-domain-containing protein, partial [Gloeopeniophorella convolvens]
RCSPEDFVEEWVRLRATGWGYKDILPRRYFEKSESFTPHPKYHSVQRENHGTSGPWKMGLPDEAAPVNQAIIDGCAELGAKPIGDFNSPQGDLGVSNFAATIDSKGNRHSVAIAYLSPVVLQRANLTVTVHNTTEKILFEDSPEGPRTVGVQVTTSASSQRYHVKARREVIYRNGSGPMTAMSIPGTTFIRSDDKNVRFDTKLAGPEPAIRDLAAGPSAPDIEVMCFPCIIGDLSALLPRGMHGISVGAMAIKPEGSGTVTLRTASIYDKPNIDAVHSENDYNVVLKGPRFVLRLGHTERMKGVLDLKPHSTDQGDLFWPGDADPDQITDDELRTYINDHALPIFHPALTLQDMPIACLNVFASLHIPNAYLTPLFSEIPSTESRQLNVNDRLTVLLEEHFSRVHPSKQMIDVLELSTPHGADGTVFFLAGPNLCLGDLGVKASHGTEFLREGGKPPLSLPYTYASLTSWLCSAIPLHTVRTFEIELPYDFWSPSAWFKIAQNLPNVEELSVKRDLAFSYLKDCSGRALRIWGNLRFVQLSPLDFSFHQREPAEYLQEILLGWLVERQDLSPPPLTITIQRYLAFDMEIGLDNSINARYPSHSDIVDSDAALSARRLGKPSNTPSQV